MNKKEMVLRALEEEHPAEIPDMLNMERGECFRLIREIYLKDRGYNDWRPERIEANCWVLFHNGDEYIDERGEWLSFESEAEALKFIVENNLNQEQTT